MKVRTAKRQAEFSVSDTGSGLPVDASDRLFEPFFTTKPRGLGMGLAISRSIIEAHRGRMWVEAGPAGQRGTTAAFSLPLGTPKTARKTRP